MKTTQRRITAKKLLKYLYIIGLMLIVWTSTIDTSVSYTVFVYYPTMFLETEANKIFSFGLERDIPIFLNPSIIIEFAFIVVYSLSWQLYNKKETYFRAIFFLMMIVIILGASGAHLSGARSWLG